MPCEVKALNRHLHLDSATYENCNSLGITRHPRCLHRSSRRTFSFHQPSSTVILSIWSSNRALNVDECKANPSVCGPHSYCTNVNGGYNCSCLEGISATFPNLLIGINNICMAPKKQIVRLGLKSGQNVNYPAVMQNILQSYIGFRMDSKSKRQRYTRQWKYARRSLDEGPVEKERLDHPLTPQEGYAERMDIDDDISSSVGTVDVGFIGSCSSGHETVNNALNEETESVNEMASTSLPTFLQEWSIKHNITHNALDDLLKGLKRNGHPELPSTARTLLKTPRTVTSSQKSGMECVHFNLRESLSDQLKRYPTEMIERNYLGKLKRLVRSGKQPLVQLAKRLTEMSTSPLSVVTSRSKTKRPNNAFILAEGKCCEAIEERNESDDSEKSNFILTDGHKTVCSGGIFRRQFGRNCPHLMVGGEQRGSYSTAVEKCSRVVETSNIETEDTTRTKKRAQKKPKRFLSEKDSSSSVAKELLFEEPQSSSEAATKNYRTKVLQKLQDIVENQQEILAMQRQLLASTAVTVVEDGGDLLDNGPCQTVEELQLLDSELAHKDKQIKMMNYLRSLGGLNPGAAVRKMLRKIALNEVLGAYSLKGKKNKKAFQDLQICNLVIGFY
ncbi:hypothetical protein E1301_Tti022504 [Triplophysa tibetana]|uniref:EGF-like domain-containing protein n=1 Tax=Triplophysa tibetana TaxID=1572043 RepID=A0A5A9PK07_9TELE|nr:hypothetical protein E1301_Tti022504 [Triplophysa tibetana]